MQRRIRSGMLAAAGTIGTATVVLLGAPQSAQAVPSYARQTGLACEACHTVFPELTPFGRRFKLNGYLLTTKEQVTDINAQKQSTLSLADLPPLSAMIQASSTWWNKALPDSNGNGSAQNNETQFPQQLSLFYAGKIADHLGAFFQLTYAQSGSAFGIDNSDIRFADSMLDNDLTYGITLNNNPTVQDLWNSTPAWSGGANAFSTPDLSQKVGTASALVANLGQSVAGLGAYADYKNKFYVEADGYHTAYQDTNSHAVDSSTIANNGSPTISGIAPYWRAAYEQDWGKHSLEVGTFGMYAKAAPQNSNIGVSIGDNGYNTYLDNALDAQYQYIGDDNIFTMQASLIHEYQNNATNGLAANATDSLNQWNLTGTYYYRRKYGASISFNRVGGSSDTGLYGKGSSTAAGGSANGSPSSQFEIFELDYMPWLNTKLLAQYTAYNWINGNRSDYNGGDLNGSGIPPRNASDENTAMIGLWTAF